MFGDEFRFCPFCRTPLTERLMEGRARRVCPACGWVRYLNPLPCAAALVINSSREILLVRRGVEPGKGLWGLPSGFIELEESPKQACLRELEEETGLKGSSTGLIGVYSQESSLYKFVIIVGYRVRASGTPKAGSDSLDAVYFPLDGLPEIAFSSHRAIIRDGTARRPDEGVNV